MSWEGFSPGHRFLATRVAQGSTSIATAVYSLPDGKELARLPVGRVICFDELGKHIAIGGSADVFTRVQPAQVRIFDTPTGRSIAAVGQYIDGVSALAFSPDGKILASVGRVSSVRRAGLDRATRRRIDRDLSLWSLNARSKPRRKKLASVAADLHYLEFSPDGRWLVGSAKNQLAIWDLKGRSRQPKVLRHHKDYGRLAFHPDGTLLACGSSSGTIRVFDVVRWRLRHSCDGGQGGLRALGFWPERQLLAAIDRLDHLLLYDLDAGKYGELRQCIDLTAADTVSTDARLLAKRQIDGEILIWHSHDSTAFAIANRAELSPAERRQRRQRALPEEDERLLQSLRQQWRELGAAMDAFEVFIENLASADTRVRRRARALLAELHRLTRAERVVTRAFRPTLLDGLKHPRAKIRASAARGLVHRHCCYCSDGLLAPLLPLLGDRNVAVRRAVAHRLWALIRADCSATNQALELAEYRLANSALEPATAANTRHRQVRFFAVMALAQLRHRQGQDAPAEVSKIARWTSPDISELGFFEPGYGRYHCNHTRIYSRADARSAAVCQADYYEQRKAPAAKGHQRCGVCGSDELKLLYSWSWADLTGKAWTAEYRCILCGKYTAFEYVD